MRRWMAGVAAAIAILSTCILVLPRLEKVGASEDLPPLSLSTRSGYVPLVVDSPTSTPTRTATPTPTSTSTPFPASWRRRYEPLVMDSSTWTPTPTPTQTATPTSTNTPTPTGTPTPIPICPGPAPVASPLPDLIAFGGLRYRDWPFPGGCLTGNPPVMTEVCVRNQGQAPAGCFVVQAGDLGWRCDHLESGEEQCWEGEGHSDLATVDVYDDVVESNEANNTSHLALPTPPPTCTPTPVSDAGASR